jgi:hypothetical protein
MMRIVLFSGTGRMRRTLKSTLDRSLNSFVCREDRERSTGFMDWLSTIGEAAGDRQPATGNRQPEAH